MLRTFWDAAVLIDPGAEKLDEKHMPLCGAGELSVLWRQSGFENVRERTIDIRMRFESFADYWEPFLLGQGPAGAYVGSLDSNQLKALRGEVKRRLSLPAEDTPFKLNARAWSTCGTVPSANL